MSTVITIYHFCLHLTLFRQSLDSCPFPTVLNSICEVNIRAFKVNTSKHQVSFIGGRPFELVPINLRALCSHILKIELFRSHVMGRILGLKIAHFCTNLIEPLSPHFIEINGCVLKHCHERRLLELIKHVNTLKASKSKFIIWRIKSLDKCLCGLNLIT